MSAEPKGEGGKASPASTGFDLYAHEAGLPRVFTSSDRRESLSTARCSPALHPLSQRGREAEEEGARARAHRPHERAFSASSPRTMTTHGVAWDEELGGDRTDNSLFSFPEGKFYAATRKAWAWTKSGSHAPDRWTIPLWCVGVPWVSGVP